MIKNIIVTPYNPEWPGMFEAEAVKIREALGDACISVHHVGSTSVHRQHGLGSQFLQLCEQWLKKQGIQSLHDEARPDAVKFYRKNGYVEMLFEDPTGEPPSLQDVAMGKKL